jgi:hypothetical protein
MYFEFLIQSGVTPMVKLLQCERCLMCAHEPLIVCAVHPDGPTGDTCLDFRLNPDLEGRKFVDFLGLQRRQNREEITNDEPFSNSFDLEPDEDLWEPEVKNSSILSALNVYNQ